MYIVYTQELIYYSFYVNLKISRNPLIINAEH